MPNEYRIIEEGPDAFYVEASQPFLFFTRWSRLRDEHTRSAQGYGYGQGSYVRYYSIEDAAEAIEYLQAAAAGYAWAARSLVYQ